MKIGKNISNYLEQSLGGGWGGLDKWPYQIGSHLKLPSFGSIQRILVIWKEKTKIYCLGVFLE